MATELMKPRLLFISPILPSPDGPGLAMRPYSQITSLSRIYSIHLLVAADRLPENPANDGDIKRYCDRIDYLDRYRFSGWKFSLWHRACRLIDHFKHFIKREDLGFVVDLGDRCYLQHNRILEMIAHMKFDQVHVFRLYLAPVADILKKKGLHSFYSLDLDDIESETRRSISELFADNGDFRQASIISNESAVYWNIENKKIPEYDRIFICSHQDRDILQRRFPGKRITILPNVAPITKRAGGRKPNRIFTMLFVGTMGYYPNADAVSFFADHIAPILRERSPQPWNLRVVGAVPDHTWIKKLESYPEMQFTGWVKDLSIEYGGADIVVTPIRGGGGTRIKILEAFVQGVPVVSTSKGVEGLEVENGVHLLVEDDARLFAEACIRLMTDHLLGNEISRRASCLADSKYSPEMISRLWTDPSPMESGA